MLRNSITLSDLVIERDLGVSQALEVRLVTLKPEVTKKYSLKTSQFTLKFISKQRVVEEFGDLLHCVLNAREAWREQENPFIVNLLTYFDDYNFIYYIMELHSEVDLYSILSDVKQFTENDSKFCSACVVCALEHIHLKKIAVRNLKVS